MKTLEVKLQDYTNLEKISINNVVCAIDSDGRRHSNQYLKPNGRMYSYKDYINYLVKRFKYDTVEVVFKNKIIFNWSKK
jgi:hypothetical protein